MMLSEKRYVAPISAAHWSGGDDLIRAEMATGQVCYWTVLYDDGRTNACGGRRFPFPAAAQAWIDAAGE